MTRTKQKSPSVKSPASSVVESAWDAFFEQNKMSDVDELRADGWMPIAEFSARQGLSENGGRDVAKRAKLETQKFRVKAAGGTRFMLFVRLPKN